MALWEGFEPPPLKIKGLLRPYPSYMAPGGHLEVPFLGCGFMCLRNTKHEGVSLVEATPLDVAMFGFSNNGDKDNHHVLGLPHKKIQKQSNQANIPPPCLGLPGPHNLSFQANLPKVAGVRSLTRGDPEPDPRTGIEAFWSLRQGVDFSGNIPLVGNLASN